MASHSLYVLILAALLLTLVPGGSAGPACACRLQDSEDCLTKCGKGWGWPGRTMGEDRWGDVLTVTSRDVPVTNKLRRRCRVKSSSTTSTSTATPTATPALNPAGAVANNEAPKPATSSSSPPAPAPPKPTTQKTSSSSIRVATTITLNNLVTPTTKPATPAPTVQRAPAPPPSSPAPAPPPPSPKPSPTTQAPPAPPPPPAQNNNSGGGSTSSSDINAYLSAHNNVRAQHGAQPLTWDDNLASKAQQWANGCVFEHSGGSLGPFGENLAAGTGSDYDISAAVKSWTDEVSQYNPSNPVASHFTQVVWKGSSTVGCAVQSCDGIFAASFGKAKFFVCEYSAQGNIIGQFAQNVQV